MAPPGCRQPGRAAKDTPALCWRRYPASESPGSPSGTKAVSSPRHSTYKANHKIFSGEKTETATNTYLLLLRGQTHGFSYQNWRGGQAARLHLPVSLRSARLCLLPLPGATFRFISSSWLSPSMAGHQEAAPCKKADVSEALLLLREQSRCQPSQEHPAEMQTVEGTSLLSEGSSRQQRVLPVSNHRYLQLSRHQPVKVHRLSGMEPAACETLFRWKIQFYHGILDGRKR